MAKKKPYTIETASDGIVTLNIAGLTEKFRTKKALNGFAFELAKQISERRTGMFHLQDQEDGRLTLVMHKTGNMLHFKNYDQAMKLAEMLVED